MGVRILPGAPNKSRAYAKKHLADLAQNCNLAQNASRKPSVSPLAVPSTALDGAALGRAVRRSGCGKTSHLAQRLDELPSPVAQVDLRGRPAGVAE